MTLRTFRRPWAIAAVVALGLLAGARAWAEIPKAGVVVQLQTVASGLSSPLTVTHANDGSGRLFIVDQTGLILILRDGALLPAPFLDVSAEIPSLNPNFDVRGLLGLAFHPDYATNGRFFIRRSQSRPGDPSEPCFGTPRGCNAELVVEYAVSADPDIANPAGKEIFRVNAPEYDHNAGEIAFGPDGYLYFSLGDGGGENDGLNAVPPAHGPIGNGQNIETTLGSVLRIDVDSPPNPGLMYAIPADNPFVGQAGADEIYAYGFRNPYRFSFDDGLGGSGALILGDVGQKLFEEVNIVYKGGNYGWATREGFGCFDPFDAANPPATCATTGPQGEPLLDPIVAYGTGIDGLSAIGGYVYRGVRSASLRGRYVFGDFSVSFAGPAGRLFVIDEPGPDEYNVQELRIGVEDDAYGLFLKGFGEDEDGELYVCGTSGFSPFGATGLVQRIAETVVIGTCNTGTDNVAITDDLSVADFITACASVAPDNKNFVLCVVGVAKGLRNAGLLTESESANLVRCASAQHSDAIYFDNTGSEAGITTPGATNFSAFGSHWTGGSVESAPGSGLGASGLFSYTVQAGPAEVDFDFGIDRVSFFYVHGTNIPAGVATAYDAKGTAVAMAPSNPATSFADPANFVSLDPLEPIARIEFSNGAIDDFDFTTQAAPPLLSGDLNDDGKLDVMDLATLLYSIGACPTEGVCPGDLDASNSVDITDVLILFFTVPCQPGACPFDFTGDGVATAEDLVLYAFFLFQQS